MEPYRLIVISSVRPEPTSAGQMLLYRHINNLREFSCEVFGSELQGYKWRLVARRLINRLFAKTHHRVAEDFNMLLHGRWLDSFLPAKLECPERTVVLTVAHGDAYGTAVRYANRQRIPLISMYHDWWPDIVDVHKPVRKHVEKCFRSLYNFADLSFCVSDGMIRLLGQHRNAVVLYPMPASAGSKFNISSAKDKNCFKILYFGNLNEYAAMIMSALKVMDIYPNIRLEVRGENPKWPADFCRDMEERGLLLKSAPRDQLNDWLRSADAFLVPMVFDASMRRRMETSFPSKLPEYAQFNKPIIIWGPEYCSAVKWGINGNKAIVVTEPDPLALLSHIKLLANDTDQQGCYAHSAARVAKVEFNPDKIQRQFMDSLFGVIGKSNYSVE